jgi:O-methyltransferase domain/Dimerisation domain
MSADLMRLATGFRYSQAIHVAATLGIADLLADGPRPSNELAREAGADPDALYRLLRALAAVGVFEEDDERRFALTPLGEPLRSDVPGSVHGWALMIGRPYFWRSWGNLEHSIRTGENSFRALHGTDIWEWRSGRPEESAIFDGAMRALTGAANAALLDAYDFGRFGTIVDVGGGNGAFLAAILDAHPAARGVLFDQPHVIDGAGPVLASVADRVSVVAGSFFDSVPSGGDAYILKWIVHDWEDEEAIAILQICRAALSPDARLLVIERILALPNEGAEGKFSDLNMLVLPGGRERTGDEFAQLFEQAGLRLAQIVETGRGYAVIEAVGSDA